MEFRQPRIVFCDRNVSNKDAYRLIDHMYFKYYTSYRAEGPKASMCFVLVSPSIISERSGMTYIIYKQRHPHSLNQHVLKLYTSFAEHLRYTHRQDAAASCYFDQIAAVLRTEVCGGVVFH